MSNMLRIVLIEDIETDAELIQYTLKGMGLGFHSIVVETPEAFQKTLQEATPDLILSDYSLPRFSALEALKIKREFAEDVPFILVTGAQSEEIAVACIKEGADDYILKDNLTRLPTSVKNALAVAESKRERKNALKELRLREEKYRNLFESSLMGMLRWRLKDGYILELNRKAKEYTQMLCDENNLFHDCFLNKEEYTALVERLAKNGVVENIEFQVKDQDQTYKWLSLSAKFFEDAGEVEGVLQDITKSKESILELQKINYELERFVYHASHDLKSPLRSIVGLVDAARESSSLEECLGFVNMFEQCASKLELLVNDLLVLARANRADLDIAPFDFHSELEATLKLLDHTTRFKKVRIEKHIHENIQFQTDPIRLRIVFNNLISNALKYQKQDHPSPFIRISITTTEDSSTIEIADNGEGIAANNLSKVFDMFYRASKNSEGSGLGLYIVKSMVEQIGGKIRVTSALNEGTTFHMVLPNLSK